MEYTELNIQNIEVSRTDDLTIYDMDKNYNS